MTTEWLLGKYMPDLRRREPRNIGVVLFHDHEVLVRFRGQRPDGTVDGRQASVKELEVYKGWIAYWHYLAESGAERQEWYRRRSFDSYWLEPGGELLAADRVDAQVLLTNLYEELVDSVSDAEWTLADRVNALLHQAELDRLGDFRRGYSLVALTGETYEYPYAYVNGHSVIADQIPQIGTRNARGRLWEFNHLDPSIHKVVFTDRIGEDRSVELLTEVAEVLDVCEATPTRVRDAFLSPRPSRKRLL